MSASPHSDLSRPPLSETALRQALLRPGALWRALRVTPSTPSTNADLADAARAGTGEGEVLVAETQTAGRGRLDRVWESPPRAGLTFSVLLRPGAPVADRGWAAVPASRHGWLPLLAGVALAEAVRRLGELDATLKWPNDLLVRGAVGQEQRKCAGILAEAVPDGGVVIGIGLNVSTREDELPESGATSLAVAGSACADRDPLLRAVLREFAQWYGDWRAAGGDPENSGLREAYRSLCGTLGREVRAALPGEGGLTGQAVDIDPEGRLVISRDGVDTPVAAGDVVHLR